MAALDHHRGGSGEPLVLVHGIGHTWRGWRPMLPRLEQRFDVLAVDLPGFGHSAALPASIPPTPEALADAVEDEMGRAGFDTAHFAGNSLGGWISLELARRARAKTVVAISPAGLQHRREKAWGASILRGMRWASQNLLTPETALLAGCPGFEATLPHTFNGQPRGLTELDVPVLLLWGTLDLVLIPRQGRRFERLIPGAELRYLPGIGHTPMSDAPHLLAEAIEEFALDRLGAKSPQAAAAS